MLIRKLFDTVAQQHKNEKKRVSLWSAPSPWKRQPAAPMGLYDAPTVILVREKGQNAPRGPRFFAFKDFWLLPASPKGRLQFGSHPSHQCLRNFYN